MYLVFPVIVIVFLQCLSCSFAQNYTANIYDQFTIRLQSFIVSQFPSTIIGSALPLVVL